MDFAAMLAHEKKRRASAKQQASERAASQAAADPLPQLTRLDASQGAPSTLCYCDNFLNTVELAKLEQSIRTKHVPNEWLRLPKRRLLNLGGVPHPDGMIAEELPSWLRFPVLDRLERMGVFPDGISPNQILLNEYEPGMGIDPHADGPLYEPCVAIISLLSPALLHFVQPPFEAMTRGGNWGPPAVANLLLSPGSLLVFADDAYNKMWHGIPDVEKEYVSSLTVNRFAVGTGGTAVGTAVPRGSRLSLTIRAVRKVKVAASEFLQPEQEAEARRRRDWWAHAISEKQFTAQRRTMPLIGVTHQAVREPEALALLAAERAAPEVEADKAGITSGVKLQIHDASANAGPEFVAAALEDIQDASNILEEVKTRDEVTPESREIWQWPD